VVTPAGWSVVFAAVPPPGAVLAPDEFAAHRIAAAEPWFGVDVDESTIPQETGLVPEAVSFTKGCYLGQELVARIDSRGHVNRVLCRLEGPGDPPRSGEPVTHGGREVGVLGSVASVAGGWVALAMVRREAGPGDAVTVGAGAPATVHETRHDGPASQSPNGAGG
jgi:folate-binding protein YgfZ